MSSIIEAQAYAQGFTPQDSTVTQTDARFHALIGFLILMVIGALTGVALSAPAITIAAGLVTAASVTAVAYSAISSEN